MDKKSKITIIISIIGLALVLTMVTYAYFAANITGVESASTISLNAGTMSINYSEGNGTLTANNIYPREEAWVTKTFTLTGYNTTSLPMKYELGLDVTNNTFPDDYLTYDLTVVSSTNGTPIATQTNMPINGTGFIKIGKGIFTNADGDTHNYELKIYFKDNGENQNDAFGAVFNAVITVSEGLDEPDGWRNAPSGTLLAGIRSNYPRLSNTGTKPGREPNSSGTTIQNIADYCNEVAGTNSNDCSICYSSSRDDFLNNAYENQTCGNYSEIYPSIKGKWIACDEYVLDANANSITFTNNSTMTAKESSLLSTPDDYGTSYYYRGDIEDNFVVFANMCWRIVRIIGNGAIKLTLYNYNSGGVSNPCDSSYDTTTAAFARINNGSTQTTKFNTAYNNNTYIGYMYSSNSSSNDFNTAHANDVDSTILIFLKAWYDQNLRSYDYLLADIIWCNDKSIITDTSYDPWELEEGVIGTGLGNSPTYYQSTYRLLQPSTANPNLICSNVGSDGKLSKFTARDTTNGNAKLYSNNKEYKIGLLTADELSFAGQMVKIINKTNFLYKNTEGRQYWTMSPSLFRTNGYPAVWTSYLGLLNEAGSIGYDKFAVRPAIALRSDVTITGGTGTQSDPFVVYVLPPAL